MLVKSDPFPTQECATKLCPVCKKTPYSEPGDLKPFRTKCNTENVGYRISCQNCKLEGKLSKYEGETGRPVRVRFKEHLSAIKRKSESSPLLKHQEMKHPGQNHNWIFSILSTFNDPLTRQVDEATRIANSQPGSLLNSKREYNHPPLNRITVAKNKKSARPKSD